jgi:hypothetical protein
LNGEQADLYEQSTLRNDALLLARVTYESFAEVNWIMTDKFADRMNSIPKHVVLTTSTL